MYGLEAVGQLIEQEIVWKEFIEAICVMKPNSPRHAAEHSKNFGRNHEATFDFMMDLRQSSIYFNYEAITCIVCILLMQI